MPFLYAPGALFIHDGELVRIVRVATVDEVLVEPSEGEHRIEGRRAVKVNALDRVPRRSDEGMAFRHLVLAADPVAWKIAKLREAVIRPLWELGKRNKHVVREAADALSISERGTYELLSRYRDNPITASLLPGRSGPKSGSTRLDSITEDIIEEVLRERFLKRQRRRVSDIVTEVERQCKRAGRDAPSRWAIQKRIDVIPNDEKLRKRHSAKKADALGPAPGHMPNADHPLSLVQIDHTLVDVFVVDEIWREVIGRPLLTIAIDVFTRMVTGFALTFFDPSSMVVGLTVVHSVCFKDSHLSRFQIKSPWPIWGKPGVFHVDNAKEFRSKSMENACLVHGIALDFRPVARPRFGGHVERLIGTMMGKVHLLPGTTFSNVIQKGDYDPAKHAVMTLAELEEWLTIQIVDIYHKKRHDGIKEPPLSRWERALVGDDLTVGLGLPEAVEDPANMFRDFLPGFPRKVRREGILLDHIWYWTDSLKPMIGRSVNVRCDPRDLSQIYLQDQVSKGYLPVPYSDLSHKPINIWEHKIATRRLEEAGCTIDEAGIFRAIERQREIEDEAARKSRAARRNIARRPKGQPTASVSAPNEVVADEPIVQTAPRVKRRFDDVRGLGALRIHRG